MLFRQIRILFAYFLFNCISILNRKRISPIAIPVVGKGTDLFELLPIPRIAGQGRRGCTWRTVRSHHWWMRTRDGLNSGRSLIVICCISHGYVDCALNSQYTTSICVSNKYSWSITKTIPKKYTFLSPSLYTSTCRLPARLHRKHLLLSSSITLFSFSPLSLSFLSQWQPIADKNRCQLIYIRSYPSSFFALSNTILIAMLSLSLFLSFVLVNVGQQRKRFRTACASKNLVARDSSTSNQVFHAARQRSGMKEQALLVSNNGWLSRCTDSRMIF